jgi:HEAT repeat protein
LFLFSDFVFAAPFIWAASFFLSLFIVVSLFILIGFTLHLRNENKSQHWKSREQKWSPLLSAVYAEEKPIKSLWNAVKPEEERYFLDYLAQQVNHHSGQWRFSKAYAKTSSLSNPYLHHLYPQLKHRDAFERSRAVDTLGKLAPELHRPHLHTALEDRSDEVAFVAFRSLIYHANAEDCKLLVAHYKRFKRFQPAYVSLLMGHLPPEHTATALMTRALQTQSSQTDTTPWERIVALQTLERWPAQVEQAGALAALATAEEETSVLIKGLILRVLLRWEAHDVLKELILDFAGQTSDYLRAYAMFALGQYPFAQHQELLELGLGDASRWVSMEAAQSLDYLEKPHPQHKRRISCSLITYSQHYTKDEVFV